MTKKGKQPWMKWYSGDWLRDPAVSMCSAATRGILMDLLCAMHETGGTGSIVGTVAQLARVARCSPEEMANALIELEATEAADVGPDGVTEALRCNGNVTGCNARVTVENRRMKREFNERTGVAQRVRIHRAKQREERGGNVEVMTEKRACNEKVTTPIFRGQKSEVREACASGAREGSRKVDNVGAVVRREVDRSLPEVLDVGSFTDAWEIWLHYLTEQRRGRAPVLATVDAQLRELARIAGEDGLEAAIDALEFAMKAGMQAPIRKPREVRQGAAAGGERSESAWNLRERKKACEEELYDILHPGGASWIGELSESQQERANKLKARIRELDEQLKGVAVS